MTANQAGIALYLLANLCVLGMLFYLVLHVAGRLREIPFWRPMIALGVIAFVLAWASDALVGQP